MKNFLKVAKVSFMVMACALFLGIGIKAEAVAPGKVVPEQTDANSGAVQVEWDAPSGDIAAYEVEWCQDKTFQGSTYGNSETAQRGCIISSLAAGKSYYVRVTAVDTNQERGATSDIIEVVTSPSAKVTGIKQTKAEDKKITLSWKKVAGANAYEIRYLKSDGTGKRIDVVTGNTTSYKLTKSIAADTKYSVAIIPVRKSSGSKAFSAIGANLSDIKEMATKPKKITKLKFLSSGTISGNTLKPEAKTAAFSWSKSNAAEGYEYTIYGNSGKKALCKGTVKSTAPNTGVRINNKKLTNTQFMRISVRGYITVNKKKVYGKASDYCWFAKNVSGIKASKVGDRTVDAVKISWKKMAGAKSYTVYIAQGTYGKFKKVGTTSKTSYSVSKFNGSKFSSGTYYYKVVASKKVGKKPVKSDDWNYKGFKITTTYTYY